MSKLYNYYDIVIFSRVSELENPSSSAESDEIPKSADKKEDTSTSVAGTDGEVCVVSALDRKGVAVGCFVLARCLQLGQAVARNEQKAHKYYTKATRFDKQVVAELHDKLTHGQL